MAYITENRSGEYRSVLSGEFEYKAFEPKDMPPIPIINIYSDMLVLVGQSNRLLGILDGLSANIPNMNLFLTMYIRKEALLSSQIEGTQASLDDILDPAIEENVNLDVDEVINYIKAMDFAVERLKSLPLCNRFIREVHEKLLSGTRGREKNPGQFRTTQNWIGAQGCTLKTASFVPPSPEMMEKAMSALEAYINSADEIDPLIKIGLVHYQFETIHPFADGNGRIGRMLITLWLIERGLLKNPVLYISYYLKRNRAEYYDRLSLVRKKGEFEQWIRFFLQGVTETAEDAIESIKALNELHNRNINKINSIGGRIKNILRLFSYIEQNPIIDIQKTAAELNLSYNTVSKVANVLIENKILASVTNAKRNRCFAYEEYLNLLKKDTEAVK